MNEEQKIIVLGLDNAGKTSLLSMFGGRLGISDLASLEPTRGVNRQEIDTEDMTFLIWDFGGQKDHRNQYLEEPEHYFQNLDLIIYVFDIQDHERLDEALNYFEKVIEIITNLKEKPYFVIFLHKYDPAIRSNEDIITNINQIREAIESEIKQKIFDYEIFLTSIYSRFPNQPKFVNLVKEIIDGKPIGKGPLEVKVERIAEVLESTMNAVIQLSLRIIKLEKMLEKKSKKPTVKQIDIPPKGKPVSLENLKEKTIKNLDGIIFQED